MDREEQRKKRRESGCEETFTRRPDALPPVRPDIPCEDPREPVAPDEFSTPAPCPPSVPDPVVIPDPLPIPNTEQTVSCAPDQIGIDSTVAAGEFEESFNFAGIPGINQNQLRFLDGLSAGARNALAAGATDVQIKTITKLNEAQAAYIRTTIAALQVQVDAVALLAAQGGLDCIYESGEATATCDGDAYTNVSAPPGQENEVNNPVTVAAGSFTSRNSQAAADSAATGAAASQLKCLYGNDDRTRTCVDIGYPTAVPVDEAAISLDGRKRVGSYTVPKGTVFSTLSGADANGLADDLAETQLSCFYLNDEQRVTCESKGKFGTVAKPGNAATGQPGNPVVVPEGTVSSTISKADANTKAEALGESLLDCYWTNSKQCAKCEDESVIDTTTGSTLTLKPRDGSEYCIAGGTIRSYASQADADDQAQLLADAQLNCIYCNGKIPSKCAPDSDPPREEGATNATAGLAKNLICAPIAQDAQNVATQLAELPPVKEEVDGDPNCCFTNDEVTVQCKLPNATGEDTTILEGSGAPDGGTGETGDYYIDTSALEMYGPKDEEGNWGDGRPVVELEEDQNLLQGTGAPSLGLGGEGDYYVDTDTWNLYGPKNTEVPEGEDPDEYVTSGWGNTRNVIDRDAAGGDFSPNSSKPVVIPAGTLVVCDSNLPEGYTGTTKEYADYLARLLGESALTCFFGNDPKTFACDDDHVEPDGGDTVLTPDSPSNAEGAETPPIEIEEDTFISFNSKDSANAIADTVGQAQLQCLFCNRGGEGGANEEGDYPGEGSCAAGELFLGQPEFEECDFKSTESSAAASELAENVSNSMAVCADTGGGGLGGFYPPQYGPGAPSHSDNADCRCPYELRILTEDDIWFNGQRARGIAFGVRYTVDDIGETGNVQVPIFKGETPADIVNSINAALTAAGHPGGVTYESPLAVNLAGYDGILSLEGGRDKEGDWPAAPDELAVLVCAGMVNGEPTPGLPQVFTVPKEQDAYFFLHLFSDDGENITGSEITVNWGAPDSGEIPQPYCDFDPILPQKIPGTDTDYVKIERRPSGDEKCGKLGGDFEEDFYYPIGAIIDKKEVNLMGCKDLNVYHKLCDDVGRPPFWMEWDAENEDGFWIYPGTIRKYKLAGEAPIAIYPKLLGQSLNVRRKIPTPDSFPRNIWLVWDLEDDDDIPGQKEVKNPFIWADSGNPNELGYKGRTHYIGTLLAESPGSTGVSFSDK